MRSETPSSARRQLARFFHSPAERGQLDETGLVQAGDVRLARLTLCRDYR